LNNNKFKELSNIMQLPIEKRALDILKVYKGTNDYILGIQKTYFTSNSFIPTKKQSDYVVRNGGVDPIVVNKLFDISMTCRAFVAEQLQLDFIPEQIFINKLLSRKDDFLHIWGCFEEGCGRYYSFYILKDCIKQRKEEPIIDPSKYERDPKPHQITAIKKLLMNDKFILADEMGLGKTTSAIIAAMEGNFKKILVVCPASLKLNWKIEISNYDSPDNISVVDGSNLTVKKWTIVNYDILKNFHHLPRRGVKVSDLPVSPIDYHKFDLVIADEAHYLKNAASNRTKIFNDFAKKIPVRWLLTGTPITNKPIDFYNLLYLCDSPVAANWVGYVKRYCAGRQFNRKGTKQKYWVCSGSSNLDELREFSSDVILRRTKNDSIDLPQKTIKPVYLPLEFSTSYNTYIAEYEAWIDEMEAIGEKPTITDHLTKLIKVRQLLSYDKIQHTIEMADEIIENGQKVIIFSCFSNTIKELMAHFGKKAVMIDGSVSKEKRQQAVDLFQNDEKITVFCGNIVAAGVGLTLTEGSVVIFNDLDWTPANHMQAEDRAHRIGQQNKVHIIYPLFDETLDMVMYKALQSKMKVIGTIMGDNPSEEEISVGKEVISSLRR
jgi:SWI/SNF-related matrix-associated actin-dependent regulator 1 of chromatin subfamily A